VVTVASDAVVAVAQLRTEEFETERNVDRCRTAIAEAAAAGAGLLVLPECALTGYRYDSAAAAGAVALAADDDRVRGIGDLASEAGMAVAVGYLERTDDALHNTVAVSTPGRRAVRVRKTHLPVLGADRFVRPGRRLGHVVDTPAGRVGVAVCYDFRFPEVSRALALSGAEIVAVPVNWSTDVAAFAEHVVPTRAIENRVFVAVADRAGVVDGVEHLGASQVVDPAGRRLTPPLDPHRDVAVRVATVDLAHARAKATVFEPGAFEIDVFADRRPELYAALTQEQCDDA
jgi:predicted amidohydrolase